MCIEELLTRDEPPYTTFADAIDDGKIIGVSSVVSITELIKVLGKKDIIRMQSTIRDLKSSEIILVDVTQPIAERAVEPSPTAKAGRFLYAHISSLWLSSGRITASIASLIIRTGLTSEPLWL